MMANETIKLVTKIGKPLINTLLTYNALDNSSCQFNLSFNEEAETLIPKDETEFLKMDYKWLCASDRNNKFEIDVTEFDELVEDNNTMIIDVREKNEQPAVDEFIHIQIPLSELTNNKLLIKKNTVVLFCQSGKRSLQAAGMLSTFFSDKHVYSLKGGIAEWKEKYVLQKNEK